MDEGRIFVANLSKGKIGEENSRLLGSFLVAQFQQAAMQRANTGEEERRDFQLYIDEFQNFTTDSFRSILSEARKYRLCLTLGHQYISQLPESLRRFSGTSGP
jgi:type IV secretory pathway TraG/TraD family ATPase VirD4